MLNALSCLTSGRRTWSLESLASTMGLLGHQLVSKQAVAKRLSEACVEFVRLALSHVLASVVQLERVRHAGWLAPFNRVLVQDSTNLPLHPRLAFLYPGSRNQSGKDQAMAKVQAVYDLTGEQLVSLDLSSFTRNDQSASQDIVDLAGRGDLVLRDLGYFVLSVFSQLHLRGVFFLSRLRHEVGIFDPEGNPFDLLRTLRRWGTLDQWVLLGTKERVPVRLVALPVPAAIANARRRQAKLNRDRRCQPTKKHLQLLSWQLLITNVPAHVWTAQAVGEIYGVRWRIEIVFKAWKSSFGLAQLPDGSGPQVQALIYARLLFLTLFQSFYGVLARYFRHTSGRHLSLLRLSRFLVDNAWLLELSHAGQAAGEHLEQLLLRHCCYPKRRKRLSFAQTLEALG